MKYAFLLLLGLPLIAAAQDGGKNFTIKGSIEHLPDSTRPEWVYLQYRVNGETRSDSVQPDNGAYRFTGNIEEPVMARLRVKFAEQNGKRPTAINRRDGVTVFLQPGTVKVQSTDSFSHVKVKGSKAHTEYARLNKQVGEYNTLLDPLYAQYSAFGKAKDKAGQDRVEAQIDSLDLVMREEVYGTYIRKSPKSPLAVYALQQYAGWQIDPDKVEPLYNLLPEKSRNLPSALDLKENVDIARKTGIGRMAMDFTQEDTLGKPVSLYSLRGRYVLIDFWASWCGPCRAENPNVVRVFNKYRDKNFHIIGVSLDRPGQKERWLKAIHDDQLYWTQVSDLKFWDNEVAKQYGIKAIPQNLLLDPEGKIIAKNLRGEELEQKLAETLGVKGF